MLKRFPAFLIIARVVRYARVVTCEEGASSTIANITRGLCHFIPCLLNEDVIVFPHLNFFLCFSPCYSARKPCGLGKCSFSKTGSEIQERRVNCRVSHRFLRQNFQVLRGKNKNVSVWDFIVFSICYIIQKTAKRKMVSMLD